MVHSVRVSVVTRGILQDEFHPCLVIEYIDGVDSLRYVVLERSIVCCIVEAAGACAIVPIKEAGVKRSQQSQQEQQRSRMQGKVFRKSAEKEESQASKKWRGVAKFQEKKLPSEGKAFV